MNTRPLMTLRFETAPVVNVGATPSGELTIWPIVGGSFVGERLRGRVLPGGADWVTQRADGVEELDLRVTLETEDGALVHMTFLGLIDEASGRGYFRTLPRFETAAPQYAFLNRLLAVGRGRLDDGSPVHEIEEVL